MEFTSWKYLITFKSYTNKRTENTCPGILPLKNTVLRQFRVSNKKFLVVVPQIIDGVPTTPRVFFPGKALSLYRSPDF